MSMEKTVAVIAELLKGPSTRIELARKTDCTPKFVGRVLTDMKERKMIYVIDYTHESDGRNRVKVYAMGDGVDAEPKRTQSQEDRSRKSYLKKLQRQRVAAIKTTFVDGVSLWQ